ncbi:helix-turn-helix domain-containing protein [Sunxiuqinia sp. A32]|uniref:helix-turn-helix domain-containing protein n=1 Tax=Sunxiuqinia sp. A32 TaxID=3461496 RepID=UPI0040462567
MNDRIKQFMSHKGITPSELADNIGVQRSNVTHVLNGRNKPSFQFIAKLLETYPEIDAKWLIMGVGDMLESTNTEISVNLFDTPKAPEPPVESTNKSADIKPDIQSAPLKNEIPSEPEAKSVERIVVFYTDQTFREYTPSK